MIKKWAGYTVVFSMFMSFLAPIGDGEAAEASVKVTLPDFAVNLNGHTVQNQNRKYPLLVYRGITYFPMTWYDTRLLGLEANWSPDDGLNIKQSQVTSSYVPYDSDRRNATTYRAEVAQSSVSINGKAINNEKEEYPLLSFRDVTYFPLTWRFAHNEFGWDYIWENQSGLSINSHNPQLQTVNLPADAGENDVALFKGYYYFVETTDTTNHVYRAPVEQPSTKEEIYVYSIESAYGLQKPLSFQIRDNSLWFTYHHGGGFMGSDQFVKIGDDGKATLIHQGYLDFRDTPYGTLIVSLGSSAFAGGNLSLSEENSKPVGDPDLMYGVITNGTTLGAGHDTTSLLSVLGDDVYVLASRKSSSDPNKIYRINLKTNQTEKILDTSVSGFRIIDNKLYYVKDEDQALYSASMDGTGETKLSDHPVSWFDSMDGHVFYTTKEEPNQFHLYQADPTGDDPLVTTTPVTDAQVVNGKLTYRDHDRFVLMNESQQLLLSVADPISHIFPSDTGILLQNSIDSSITYIR